MLAPPRLRAGRGQPQRAVELDEMWSYVGAKVRARWLWHALDHHSGRVLAYVIGARKDATFLKLKALLASFGITRFYTDKAGVYRRHLPLNNTQ
jgi:insertion element IS1 protein InsB